VSHRAPQGKNKVRGDQSVVEHDPGEEGEETMFKRPLLNVMAIALAAAMLSFVVGSVAAATLIMAPAGTKVGLKFVDPVDTAKAASGERVHFKVIDNVIVKGHILIKRGTELMGTINAVGHPFPQNAGFANIGSLFVTTVDRKRVALNDVRVSAPLLGGDIRVKPGTYVTTTTKANVSVLAP
jgi:hypothetical protein